MYKLMCAVLGVFIVVTSGCWFSNAPAKPKLSPDEAGRQALEEYDSDGDGFISEEEAASSPGVASAFAKIDTNGDKQLSAQEIADRINYYKSSTSWVINGQVRIEYRGRPLPGAMVTFDPEPFLGASFQVCSGETDTRGEAFITGQDSQIPGIFLGFYRVRVTKEVNGKELLAPKYNTETILGFEANNDVPEVPDVPVFKLR